MWEVIYAYFYNWDRSHDLVLIVYVLVELIIEVSHCWYPHTTQVYVQWMSYSFVWLYLLKCVFTCSIFIDSNTKRFFSVLSVFGKYFVFTKIEKFQKQCCPVLVTQLRVIQVTYFSRELACWVWWLVREWKVQLRGVHRDFHDSARNSLEGRPSSCKK